MVAIEWDSKEEWEIEQRSFHAVGRDDVPVDVQQLVAKLWAMYCHAAAPSSPGKDGGQEVEAVGSRNAETGFVELDALPDSFYDERQTRPRITPGLYRVFWNDGSHSDCAIGMESNGDNWIAPTNWLTPSTIRKIDRDGWAVIDKFEPIQPASTALVERLTKALQQVADARCDHDMGFDREIGPLGCSLGDKCVCVGLCTIASRALQETAGLSAAPKADTTMVDAVKNALGLLDTPVGRRRHEGDSFYSDVVASLRSALSSSTSREGESRGTTSADNQDEWNTV